MNEIMVESNVPMPEGASATKVPWAKLYKEMNVGDSFLIPEGTYKNDINARTGAFSQAKRMGIKVSVRQVEGGVRVWRIA